MLADTSVWIDHLRGRDRRLRHWLEEGMVSTHPFVIGELACATIRNRREVLRLLARLPACAVAAHDDVLILVETHKLTGTGLGWVDVHLLAAAKLSGERLVTSDRRLAEAARAAGVGV